MNKIILTAAVAFAFAACNKGGSGYKIEGEIKGLPDNKKVYLIATNFEAQKFDTLSKAVSKDGKFELKGTLTAPDYCALVVEGERAGSELMVENVNIKVKGSIDSLHKLNISGSKSHDEFIKVEATLKKSTDKLQAIQQKAMMMGQQPDEHQMQALQLEYMAIQNQMQNDIRAYAKSNPSSVVAPVLLINTNQDFDVQVFQPIYNSFTEEVKATPAAKYMKSRLDKEVKLAIGQKAPELKALTPDGKALSLSESRGKVTLIDFWASWCKPCRMENPNVVKVYEKYHGQGFNILGISLDKDAEAWKKAIGEDKLQWNHISDLKYWDSALAKEYNVQSIPYSILLDKNGVIVAKNLRGEELEKKVAELMAKN
ncbi:TlpA disulfide reductase family protein [Solitalea lacus]|uniref:TlpA disulfide reductase family protein n=1 Tax=Solitalea lacus TaxID=2911172 RepID=UPI001EDA47C3|nr:TlpA disulfide reductase family protein [Solitalea lacus]UKJ09059.1 AhpC/TSA family protein [Solitalea lacus]